MKFKAALASLAVISFVAAPAYAGEKDGMKKERMTEKGDVVDVAAEAGMFSTLIAAVQAAGLEDTLRNAEKITVFAPTDEAFAALPAGALDDLLLPENREQLRSILTFHVAEGKAKSKSLAGKTTQVTTLNGQTVTVDGSGEGVTVNGASVVKADVYASNGVIHVIDEVLMPSDSASTSSSSM